MLLAISLWSADALSVIGIAFVIGVMYGVFGGGGSALLTPALVYLVQVAPVLATSYTLFVVTLTTFVGALQAFRQQRFHQYVFIYFGIASIVGTFVARWYVIPLIPRIIIENATFLLTKDSFIMLTVALLIGIAGGLMLHNPYRTGSVHISVRSYMLCWQGFAVGIMTGIAGAGGGFLMMPLFTAILKLPLQVAIGTTLSITATKSLAGLLADAHQYAFDWVLVSWLCIASLIGIQVGRYSTHHISAVRLQRSFGYLLLLISILIFLIELKG